MGLLESDTRNYGAGEVRREGRVLALCVANSGVIAGTPEGAPSPLGVGLECSARIKSWVPTGVAQNQTKRATLEIMIFMILEWDNMKDRNSVLLMSGTHCKMPAP